MIKKVIQTMFYGSLRAKLYLWSIFVLIMAMIFMGVMAAIVGSVVFMTGAITSGVAAFVLSQSISLEELQRKKKKGKSKTSVGRSATGEKTHSTGNISTERQEGKTQGELSVSEEEEEKEKERAKARYLASLDKKKMKHLFKEHKVFQKHILVMIDSFQKMKITQTPAVMWQTKTHVHFLMLNAETQEVKVPLDKIKGILFQKNVPADPSKDYAMFQYANFATKLYQKYLPDYQQFGEAGKITYVKTLFTIEPGISFTNTSMNGVFTILTNVPLLVDDAVNMSKRFDEYFKEVYRYSLLCKSGVYSLEEYREKMEGVLEEYLNAPVTSQQFSKTLMEMNMYHLITSDYVTKYTQKYMARNKQK